MGPEGYVTLWEDFLTDNVTNFVETVAGSGAQDIHGAHGGWWGQVVGANDSDSAAIAGEVVWEVDEGQELTFETRVQIDDVSVASTFVGMSDANNDSVVIEDEDGTLNTVATDAFGVLLEGEQDETFQAMGVQNDSDNTQDALTGAVDAADAVTRVIRMVATTADSGTVRYYIGTANEYGGGTHVATKTSWYRSGILYTPILSLDARGTACNADYDYIYVSAPR